MTEYPHLALADIAIDAELARRLPRKLAYYHLALPVAADDKQLSLAMAYPENALVVEMLGSLMNTPVVPVHSSVDEIRAALDQIWQFVEKPIPHLLSWGYTPERAFTAQRAAATLAEILSARVTDAQHNDLDTLLMLTQQDTYSLTVISTPISSSPSQDLPNFIRKAATPVLLLYGEVRPFQRIMFSLRGHSPDLSALDLIIPLAQAIQAEMTVLAVTGVSQTSPSPRSRLSYSLAALLDPQQEPAQHLAACVDRLTNAGIQGYMKLCQGDPVQQVGAEFTKGNYSLLVITSEAYGDFVNQVIEAVQARKDNFAVLIVKPGLAP